ncbi:high frequency lysogenization protein HflD [Colwellia echini]|uniref:High frequency lysogenization protein HflD homolog n=1 Tax=Colwellia echini TaxID=1982103 RepID=A0ABY3MZV5_9GAMM|nr:high frequency lysogenization protein HflD [Colwellia echini]TYK66730.1 high frequency lysogenization protein HflD [Colwellia echini]
MKDQTLTFAAICQVAHHVQQVSHHNRINEEDMAVLLNSLIQMSPENTLAVYGSDMINLKQGLELLVEHLGDSSNNAKKDKDPEFTRYLINLINLERRLNKQPKQLSLLGERLEACNRQLDHYPITSETLIASFASIYSDIISPLGASIQVTGNPAILKQTNNQHKIRALLLSGIRAAVLWRQVGGKRRNILFHRKKIISTAKELLNSI